MAKKAELQLPTWTLPKVIPDDNRAVIDVLYEWDENGSLDNQYPGTKALKSFIFVFEDGVWKLDDVYTFSDEYASPESLRAYFSRQ